MHAHFVNDLSIRTRIWDWVCRASVCSVALSTRHAMEVATNHELHRRHFPDLIAPSHCCHYLLDHRLLDMIELNDRFWRFYCRALFIDVVAIFFDNKSPYCGLCDVTTRLLLLCDIMRRLLFCVVTPLAWLCQLQLGHPQAIAQLVSDVLAHFLFNALDIIFRTFCIRIVLVRVPS